MGMLRKNIFLACFDITLFHLSKSCRKIASHAAARIIILILFICYTLKTLVLMYPTDLSVYGTINSE